MSVFADSSALVKLYAPESGYETIRSLTDLIVSQLARVEVPSAIWKKHRMAAMSASEARAMVDQFEADYFGVGDQPPRFAVVPISEVVLDVAARRTGIHGLRGYDAIQLATAQVVASADRDCREFACYDKALSAAAIGEGFRVLPSEQPGR
ncbi:type II toxin-antitoxin system VapC family toxin [Amycolatopsis taiwanensis]|uniref:Twitching motility protein PilT n=1 Tax=Amycolatopsis taiwanensis TaxID=342230 RepID=A0A9W6VEC5_9PSEU|nr:type II toxin-antitoxin system VapC family toxin [Amycolatopsis taiwanensis]GLY68303.1 twitching motility protein PilT [Amycolatopsis taiwanensis]